MVSLTTVPVAGLPEKRSLARLPLLYFLLVELELIGISERYSS